MNKTTNIFGDVNRKGKMEMPFDITLKAILNDFAGGIKDYRRVKLIQIGGPLGICVSGKDLNNKLSDYEECMTGDMVIFLSDQLCPVDYMRFLTRFMVRELRIDNDHIRKLNQWVESFTQGTGTMEELEMLESAVAEDVVYDMANGAGREGKSNAENSLNSIFRYMLSEFRSEIVEHIVDKKCKNGICRGLFVAQCMNACPADVYIPGYIELMKHDRVEDAYRLMRRNNPLSFVCGNVCARPCEDRCRRGEIESTVGVRALKRYAADMALKIGDYKEEKQEDNGREIAIIGSGPAGLTAAYYLAKTGYSVVVYEASNVLGGMLAMGIPEYRLPQETINKEIQLIANLGVKFVTNTRIGVDMTMEALRADYDSVLLATGCHIGNAMGSESKGIETAVGLLREVKVEGRKDIGKNVLVIGGGDVAMDAARTSVRLGAENVIVASLETYETMPANDDEKHEAKEEGIQLINGYGMEKIHVENESVAGITLKKCLSVVNDEGRFSPEYDDNDQKELKIDNLVFAMGQRPDNSYLDTDVELSDRGWINVNRRSLETSAKGIFAAGDMNAPGNAVDAIAEGKRAAESIDSFLGGNGLFIDGEVEVPDSTLKCTIWDIEKSSEVEAELSDRKGSFEVVSKPFLVDEAKQEASRCMRCDRNTRAALYLR